MLINNKNDSVFHFILIQNAALVATCIMKQYFFFNEPLLVWNWMTNLMSDSIYFLFTLFNLKYSYLLVGLFGVLFTWPRQAF